MPSTRTVASIGAILTFAALLLQYWLQFRAMPGASPLAVTWRYFGYFTILTNSLVCVTWTVAAREGDGRHRSILEGIALTNIVMVGLMYHLLLAGTWRPEGAQWVADFIVHTVTPILFAVYWLARPHGALKWWNAVTFMAWPLAYCIYALVRGAFDGWYAYWFLNPATTSLPILALSILAQSVAFIAAGLGVIALDKKLAARASRSPQPSASPSAP
jgi:hypothetical protein